MICALLENQNSTTKNYCLCPSYVYDLCWLAVTSENAHKHVSITYLKKHIFFKSLNNIIFQHVNLVFVFLLLLSARLLTKKHLDCFLSDVNYLYILFFHVT